VKGNKATVCLKSGRRPMAGPAEKVAKVKVTIELWMMMVVLLGGV
jgi:hypothetical protein